MTTVNKRFKWRYHSAISKVIEFVHSKQKNE